MGERERGPMEGSAGTLGVDVVERMKNEGGRLKEERPGIAENTVAGGRETERIKGER